MEMKIVMNERQYAEDFLNGGKMINGLSYTLCILARYFQAEKVGKSQIKSKLSDIVSVSYPKFTKRQKDKIITKAIKNAEKHGIYEISEIPISKPEYERIIAIQSLQHKQAATLQKLAFTLLCLVKLNLLRGYEKPCLNLDFKVIYKFANCKVSKQARLELLKILIDAGLVEVTSTRIDNQTLKINFVEDGEPALVVKDVNQAGKIFEQFTGRKKFIICERCGEMTQKKTNGRMKYCHDCAKKINIERVIKRRREEYAKKDA